MADAMRMGPKPSISVPTEDPPEAASSGATPHMRAASIGPVPGSPPAMWLASGRSGVRRTSRDESSVPPPELTPSLKAPKGEGSTDAASSSRNASLDIDDAAHHEAMLAVAATAAAAGAGGGAAAAAAAGGVHADGASGKGGNESGSSEEEEDDSDGEDGSLLRMLRMRQNASPQKRGSAQGQRSSPAAAAFKSPQPGTPATPTLEPLPPEEGWDSVGSSAAARRTRKSSSGTSEQAAEGGGGGANKAKEEAKGGGGQGGGMVADDEDDGFFGSAYDAAKDGSRRQIGKHGRSVRQSVERNYAIEARVAQRGGGR